MAGIYHEPPEEFAFRDLSMYPSDIVMDYRLDVPNPQPQRQVWSADNEPEGAEDGGIY